MSVIIYIVPKLKIVYRLRTDTPRKREPSRIMAFGLGTHMSKSSGSQTSTNEAPIALKVIPATIALVLITVAIAPLPTVTAVTINNSNSKNKKVEDQNYHVKRVSSVFCSE